MLRSGILENCGLLETKVLLLLENGCAVFFSFPALHSSVNILGKLEAQKPQQHFPGKTEGEEGFVLGFGGFFPL